MDSGIRSWENRSSLILVVGNTPSGRAALMHALEPDGYTLNVRTCDQMLNGGALSLSPDCVLISCQGRDADALEVLYKMRACKLQREVPAVLVMESQDRDLRLKGLAAGADAVLGAPIDSLEIRAWVKNTVRMNRYRKLVKSQKSIEELQADIMAAYQGILESWSHAMELRDRETKGHTDRVRNMTIRLAEAMGFSKNDLAKIGQGALLHDIGKMAMPDSIVLKPDKLTAEEFDVIKQHPLFAQEILAELPFLKDVLDIPLYHHEKWDGTGYPKGLAGKDIPLAARIFAVVDVWDALSSQRPYKEPWPEEKVRQYIREQAGTHFDPYVVEKFLELDWSQD